MANHTFGKFMNLSLTGAKKKEALKQDKRREKAEARAQGEERRKQKLDRQRNVTYGPSHIASTKFAASDGRTTTTRGTAASGSFPERRGPVSDRPADTYKSKSTGHPATRQSQEPENVEMPLNKFVSHAGICGRREAAAVVKEGKVSVNGKVVTEPGFKVTAKDNITIGNKRLFPQRNLVYILLNKPKDHITTVKDPRDRKTVLNLVEGATENRIFPVGRLDRNTTGVLLMTNDGELTQKLTHPSFEVKKVYEAKLDKPLAKSDFDAILNGVELEDGKVHADSLGYVDIKDKCVIGIEIHSGKNRVVRRIFEHLGYEVKNLDRVMFANLTKKNVERGKWRMLNEKEIRLLKYMNQSFVRNAAKK